VIRFVVAVAIALASLVVGLAARSLAPSTRPSLAAPGWQQQLWHSRDDLWVEPSFALVWSTSSFACYLWQRRRCPWKAGELTWMATPLLLHAALTGLSVRAAWLALYYQMTGQPPGQALSRISRFTQGPLFWSLFGIMAASVPLSFLLDPETRRYRALKRLARQHKLCTRCGYILDGLPAASPSCPECGTKIPACTPQPSERGLRGDAGRRQRSTRRRS